MLQGETSACRRAGQCDSIVAAAVQDALAIGGCSDELQRAEGRGARCQNLATVLVCSTCKLSQSCTASFSWWSCWGCVARSSGLLMVQVKGSFDLRQWHSALGKLRRTSEVAAADHVKTGMAWNHCWFPQLKHITQLCIFLS